MKIFTLKTEFVPSSETIILFGLLNDESDLTLQPHDYNLRKESKYNGVIDYCKNNLQYVDDVKDSDVIVYPKKFSFTNDNIHEILNKYSIQYEKKYYIFYNDDNDQNFVLNNKYAMLFRTSFDTLKCGCYEPINTSGFITISPDYFTGYITKPKLNVGFCGSPFPDVRKNVLMKLMNSSNIETNFQIRSGFWAPGVPKDVARLEYFQNIHSNMFTICVRGAGNFSYRLLETIMMGRIPILFNTNGLLPLDKIFKSTINYIEVNSFQDLCKHVIKYYSNNIDNLLRFQQENRESWIKHFSPIGFIKNISFH